MTWSAPSSKRRWRRTQRFSLSGRGAEAEQAYREAVVASRTQEGRAAFEAAIGGWAALFKLTEDDGAILGELRTGPRTLPELAAAFESSGRSAEEVRSALERLEDAELLALNDAPNPRGTLP